jgi:two-component system chemotaxis response regulator CheY
MAKILVVDDAQFMRMKCRTLLKGAGYEVVEAGDGEEAVAKYQADRPDAVLLDVTMPKMDGLQALEAIRKIDPHARVAMLTATGQQAVVREAIEAGARDFVVKPFDDARVLQAVENLLG